MESTLQGSKGSHVWQGVHRQLAVVHAIRHTLGKQSGGGSVPHAQAVGYRTITFLATGLSGRSVHVPPGSGRAGRILDGYLVAAGLQGNIPQQHGRSVDPVFTLHKLQRFTKHRRSILAVDED